MGRHGGRERARPRGRTGLVIVIVLLLAGAVALGLWWWNLRDRVDPIDADPVDAHALVVGSVGCTDPGVQRTVVDIVGTDPVVQATLDACGYRVGQRIAVQYLAGDPQQIRLSGTMTAGDPPMLRTILPFAILAAGLVAVGATLVLIRGRYGTRHSGRGRVSVADLQAALDEQAPAGQPVASPADQPAEPSTDRPAE